jgi:tetratricopeptide (TPR) repeat protein
MNEGPSIQRRLAAILAADIAGYSRIMHADEAATVRDLKAHQSVILPLIGRHGGRIIDTAGDGILAEFPSVIGATECAVEIQTVMTERNEGVPEDRRMLFRIGITLLYRNRWDPEPAKVLARADEAATRAISTAPNYAHAHYVKAEVLGLSNRFDAALATYDRAIALDRNHAAAYVGRARNLNVIGRAAEALAPVETAIRLSPRDPELYVWYFVLCHVYTHLARDAQAIEWCLKSLATGKTFWFAYVDLASAYAWRGQSAEAAAAVAELLKLGPGYTVRTLVQEGSEVSDNPVFRKEFQRIVEGARKAGLPES